MPYVQVPVGVWPGNGDVYLFTHDDPHYDLIPGRSRRKAPVQIHGPENETASARLAEKTLPWLAAITRGLPEPMVLDPSATAACA